MATVILPQNFQMKAISKFTEQIVSKYGNPVSDEVLLDFGKINFIDGSGYTVLSNSIEWLIRRGVSVRFLNFDNIQNHAIQYLDDCGFFRKYLKSNLRSYAKIRDTTLPCAHIEQEYGFGWVEKQLSPWIQWHLRASHGQLASVRTCVKEVLNNIADHSTVDTGFVHAQFYPTAKHIKITMSDFGPAFPILFELVTVKCQM